VSRFKLLVAGQTALLPPEVNVDYPRRQAAGSVEQVPVTGRPYATGVAGQWQAAQATVAVTVRGRTPSEAMTAMNAMERLLRLATRIYDGARYLPVLRVATIEPPTEGFAGLSWRLSATYDLLSPLSYLGPDDQRPRATPLEQDSGLYVLGALEIIGGGDDFVDLLPLAGYTTVAGTYTAPFSGIAYEIVEVEYDDIE